MFSAAGSGCTRVSWQLASCQPAEEVAFQSPSEAFSSPCLPLFSATPHGLHQQRHPSPTAAVYLKQLFPEAPAPLLQLPGRRPPSRDQTFTFSQLPWFTHLPPVSARLELGVPSRTSCRAGQSAPFPVNPGAVLFPPALAEKFISI